ncbi:hypothetical protein BRD17_10030, partial [Halobacteriales archaeon SW_7_68_16]
AGVRGVHEETFELTRWTRHGADLAVHVPDSDRTRSFEVVALPYSPAVETEAPLVDVGHGTPPELDAADVAGAVVVATTATPPGFDRPYHRVEKVGHAAAAGAAAFVFVNHRPGQLPPTGSLRFDAEAAIPGLGVSKETGAWLREYADEGARARVRVDAGTDPATSRNVVGLLGPDGGDPDGSTVPDDRADGRSEPPDDGEGLVLAHMDPSGPGRRRRGRGGRPAGEQRARTAIRPREPPRRRQRRRRRPLPRPERPLSRLLGGGRPRHGPGRRRGPPGERQRAPPPLQRPLAVPAGGRPGPATPQRQPRRRRYLGPRLDSHPRGHPREGPGPQPPRPRHARCPARPRPRGRRPPAG